MTSARFHGHVSSTVKGCGKVHIAFPRERKWEYVQKSAIVVSTYGIPAVFRRSFLKILVITSTYYHQVFGAQSTGWLELNVRKLPNISHRLWTNGSDHIYLTLSRKRQLEPPQSSHVFNIHGLTHELGHIVLYRSLININQLPDGWGEGWAIYLASFMAVPHLFSKCGQNLWPYPYDYLKAEGPEKYLRRFESLSKKKKDPVLHVVYKLHLLHRHLGNKGFQQFFRQLLKHPVRSDMFCRKVDKEIKRTCSLNFAQLH